MTLSTGKTVRRIFAAVLLLSGALVRAEAQTTDTNRFWTTVGSAGTADESDPRKIVFDHATAHFGQVLINTTAAAAPGAVSSQTDSAVIRYDVTPVDGLFQPGVGALQVRYLATGPGARVVAKLIEVDLATGLERSRITFDSTAFAASKTYHVNGVEDCSGHGGRFDFVQKAYYVEVTLTHSSLATGGAAGVQIIKIVNNVCLK